MNNSAVQAEVLLIGKKLSEDILRPMKGIFVGKDEIIDLLGVCLVARENLFLHGPPGTAKSALVQDLAKRIEGNVFDYLLTRFTEPNEVFGPFDIRKLRDGELKTNTEGMLPEATFVFLDELLNANSAILNSLLLVLNERVFRRGRETQLLPTLMVVGASNSLPDDDALGALFDRFLLRVTCGYVPHEELSNVLDAGWKLEQTSVKERKTVSLTEVKDLHNLVKHVDFSEVRSHYVELIRRLRHAGISVSDRRAVKLQRVLAASALLCGRLKANRTDFWVLRYIWDTEEQKDILNTIIADVIEKSTDEEKEESHTRSQNNEAPNPEHLSQDLDQLETKLKDSDLNERDLAYLQDQLGILSSRSQWVVEDQQREFLDNKIRGLWDLLGEK
ncbi:MAG: AAA family ATPase [Pirellulaceae bacterium]|nr:AAA family ATPase [Pirellulaceae bacterium]